MAFFMPRCYKILECLTSHNLIEGFLKPAQHLPVIWVFVILHKIETDIVIAYVIVLIPPDTAAQIP